MGKIVSRTTAKIVLDSLYLFLDKVTSCDIEEIGATLYAMGLQGKTWVLFLLREREEQMCLGKGKENSVGSCL